MKRKRQRKNEIFKKNIDILIVYIFVLLIFLPRSINFCEEFSAINFDTQNLLLWSLSHSLNIIPIKDFYYPYGIIFYGTNYIKSIFLLYINIAPVIITSIYVIFKNVFGKRTFLGRYLFIIFFIISTGLITRIQLIDRYLSPFVMSLILFLLNDRYKNNLFNYFIVGIINGIFLFYDPGIGVIALFLTMASFAFFIIYEHALNKGFKISINKLIKSVFIFIIGLLLGLVPYIIFLYRNGIGVEFIRFLKDISSAASFVKSPVLVLSKYHMLIFLTITIQSVFIINAFNNRFKKYSKVFYYFLFANYVISIVLLQKHFLRSIENILMVYSINAILLMFFPISSYFNYNLKKNVSIYIGIFAFVLIFILSFSVQIQPLTYYENFKVGLNLIFENNYLNNRLCDLEKFNRKEVVINSSYNNVSSYIKYCI